MNYDTHDDLEQPMFTQHDNLAVLEEQLYGHVRKAIDFGALSLLEQSLCMLLENTHAMPTDLALDIAAAVMHRALSRAANDSARYVDTGPPLGITEAEKAAVARDEDCPFCAGGYAPPEEAQVDDEACPCCEELAAMWRTENHGTLVKAGLAKAKSSS